MVAIYKRLDKRVKSSGGKVLDFYNNLFSGIIGGLIISYMIFYWNKIIFPNNLLFALIVILFWYFLGLGIIKNTLKNTKLSKEKHLRNYKFNVLAAIIGAVYVSVLALFYGNENYYWISALDTLVLAIVALIVMIFVIAKPNN